MLLPAIKELTFKLLTSACSFEVDCCRMSLAGASSLSLMHFALALPSMSTTVSRAASRSSTYLEHSKISSPSAGDGESCLCGSQSFAVCETGCGAKLPYFGCCLKTLATIFDTRSGFARPYLCARVCTPPSMTSAVERRRPGGKRCRLRSETRRDCTTAQRLQGRDVKQLWHVEEPVLVNDVPEHARGYELGLGLP